MSVDVTYCLVEWENYFTEKPLSFDDFVKTYKNYDIIYPHILEKVKQISGHPEKLEYFIQGFVGSGKSTLVNLLVAYKVYLFLLLKSPKDFFGFSPRTQFNLAIFAPNKKSATLTMNSILNTLECVPLFSNIKNAKSNEDKCLFWHR